MAHGHLSFMQCLIKAFAQREAKAEEICLQCHQEARNVHKPVIEHVWKQMVTYEWNYFQTIGSFEKQKIQSTRERRSFSTICTMFGLGPRLCQRPLAKHWPSLSLSFLILWWGMTESCRPGKIIENRHLQTLRSALSTDSRPSTGVTPLGHLFLKKHWTPVEQDHVFLLIIGRVNWARILAAERVGVSWMTCPCLWALLLVQIKPLLTTGGCRGWGRSLSSLLRYWPDRSCVLPVSMQLVLHIHGFCICTVSQLGIEAFKPIASVLPARTQNFIACHYSLKSTVHIIAIVLGIVGHLDMVESPWKNMCRFCAKTVPLYRRDLLSSGGPGTRALQITRDNCTLFMSLQISTHWVRTRKESCNGFLRWCLVPLEIISCSPSSNSGLWSIFHLVDLIQPAQKSKAVCFSLISSTKGASCPGFHLN